MDILKRELPNLQSRYGVAKIGLFGSFASGKPHKRSDVDLVVELDRPLGFEFVEMVYYLEALLCRKVDLTTFACLQRALQNPNKREIAETVERSLILC